jgi:hypothetical protein
VPAFSVTRRLLDHRTRQARAGIAGRLGLVVVRIGVDDQAAADDVEIITLADVDVARHRAVDGGHACVVGLMLGMSPPWCGSVATLP